MLDPYMEGLYQAVQCNTNGSYKLRDNKGKILTRTWNEINLRKALAGKKCFVVALDHLTRQVEVKALATITARNVKEFFL